MKDSKGESAATELKKLQDRQDALTAIEKRIRDGKAELKSLVPDDAQQAIGHGVRAKRSKSGAISFDLVVGAEGSGHAAV